MVVAITERFGLYDLRARTLQTEVLSGLILHPRTDIEDVGAVQRAEEGHLVRPHVHLRLVCDAVDCRRIERHTFIFLQRLGVLRLSFATARHRTYGHIGDLSGV